MDLQQLQLKFDSRFIIEELSKHVPENLLSLWRIKNMNDMFKVHIIKNDAWDKEKLYLIFMLIHYFECIKKHVIEYHNQHLHWVVFINQYLSGLVTKHINFELNAFEFTSECLDVFFII